MMESYIVTLYKDIPTWVYAWMLVALIIFGITVFAFKCFKDGCRKVAAFALLEYLLLIYCSTVIFRHSGKAPEHNFTPFWSYSEPRLIDENIMNTLVFIPVGLLIGTQITPTPLRKGWLIAFLIGTAISVSIEAMQYFLHRGFSEVDDVMHNTLGCMIGYGVYRLIYMCVNSKTKRIYGK